MKRISVILIALGILSTTVFGDDFADASIAYDKKEYKKAFKLYNQACDSGSAEGCGMVGAFFEGGVAAVQANTNEALAYYNKACDMGSEHACKYYTELQAKLPVCTEDELSFVNDKRYFYVSSSDSFPLMFADGKTIKIDKKNKIIKVWMLRLGSEKGRQFKIKSFEKYYPYDNFGYQKDLVVINYSNMKNMATIYSDHNCDGTSIHYYENNMEWSDTIPGSVMESITESIMKKYNLK